MVRSFSIIVAMLIAFALRVAPAQAIAYGSPDGDGHPNVGVLVAEWRLAGQKDVLCSGTLIAPTVFLTAAHCTAFLESLGITDVWVAFDAEFTASSEVIPGSMHTNPGFNQAQGDPGDIAVIVLSSPVEGITPASLPPAGLLDLMAAARNLKGHQFTAVGYGASEPVLGSGQPSYQSLGIRQVATSTFLALNHTWLRLSQNATRGDGGTCSGDSGGPNFVGTSNVIAAITVTGDAMCLATNVTYRLDAPSARAFLQSYVSLP